MLRAGASSGGRAALIVAALLLAIPLVGHAAVGLFSRYAADDYCTAGQLVDKGLLGMQSVLYQAWSGRFSFTFMVGLVELPGAFMAALLPGLLLLAWIVALAWAIARVGGLSVLAAVVLAELVVVATLQTTADVGQSVYWQTGALTYLAPLVLVTVLAGVLRHALDRGRWSLASATIVALLALVAGGTSETYAAVQSTGLAIAFGLVLLLGGREARGVLLPLLGIALVASVTALGVVLAAPGNAVRQEGNPTPNLAFALRSAVDEAREFVRVFVRFSTPVAALVVALPAVVAVGVNRGTSSRRLTGRRAMVAFLILVAAAALLVVCLAPSYYAISAPQPGRARILPQMLVVITFAAGGWLAGQLLQPMFIGKGRDSIAMPVTGGADGRSSARLVRLVPATLVGVLLMVVSLGVAWEVVGRLPAAQAYAARWDGIDAQIRGDRASGIGDVTVPPLELDGNIRGMDFVSPERANWLNECVARYYRIRTIASAPTG